MEKNRRFLLVGLILIAASISMATERPTEFRGLTWGTDFSTVKDEMVHSRTDPSYGGIEFYLRKNDEMVIGGAKIDRIEYGFWQNKFFGVSILFLDFTNFSSLKGALFERFGSGNKPNRYIEEYFWFDFAEAYISIKYNKIQKKAILECLQKNYLKRLSNIKWKKTRRGRKRDFECPLLTSPSENTRMGSGVAWSLRGCLDYYKYDSVKLKITPEGNIQCSGV